MHVTELDMSQIKMEVRQFIEPYTVIYTDPDSKNSTHTYTIETLSRNGVLNVVHYVPRDVCPHLDKPEKVHEQLLVRFAGDVTVTVDVRAVENGDDVIEAIGPNITDPNMLTVRDQDGFIKLIPVYTKTKYLRNFNPNNSDYAITLYGAQKDDFIPPNLVNAIMMLSGDRVRVNYVHRPFIPGIINGKILMSAMEFLKAISDAVAKAGVPAGPLEVIVDDAVRIINGRLVEDDYYC
ncbi:MAG: hypothetical protein NC489_08700 [Ruminococcus flavefaciens]|nr:hypothetical protein [Ruminococcus flavefaciens]